MKFAAAVCCSQPKALNILKMINLAESRGVLFGGLTACGVGGREGPLPCQYLLSRTSRWLVS